MSFIDGIVLVLCPFLMWIMFPMVGPMTWSAPFAIGHFFLFCNVFRIRRTFELWWALIAIINVSAWMAMDQLNWWFIMMVQTPVTAMFVIWEMRSPEYHGVGARWCNPDLDDWLRGGGP